MAIINDSMYDMFGSDDEDENLWSQCTHAYTYG